MKTKKLNLQALSFLLLAFCFVLITGMQCKKSSETPKEVLPAETQTGKGTFGCLVNGEVWLPKGKSFIPALSTTIQFNILSINTLKFNEYLSLAVRDLDKVGDYNLLLNNNIAQFTITDTPYKCIEGIITITKYDKASQIISGKFWFNAQNSGGEIIKITDGRFDDKYTN